MCCVLFPSVLVLYPPQGRSNYFRTVPTRAPQTRSEQSGNPCKCLQRGRGSPSPAFAPSQICPLCFLATLRRFLLPFSSSHGHPEPFCTVLASSPEPAPTVCPFLDRRVFSSVRHCPFKTGCKTPFFASFYISISSPAAALSPRRESPPQQLLPRA